MSNVGIDSLDELLQSAKDRSYKPKKNIDKRNDLNFSEEEIDKLRKETLDKIDAHVKKMKSEVNKDGLADYMLENRIELLEQSKYMLNEYMVTILTNLASSSRAFEVLAKMMDTVASINNSVVNINSDKAKVKDKDRERKLIENTTSIIGDIVQSNISTVLEQNKFKDKNAGDITVIDKNGTDK